MKIMVVEDDDIIFDVLENCLKQAGITDIERAPHKQAAMLLLKHTRERAVWIIDGMFPLFEGDAIAKLGPNLACEIRSARGEQETIIGFSANPDTFQLMNSDSLDFNFNKSQLGPSMLGIKKIILELSLESKSAIH